MLLATDTEHEHEGDTLTGTEATAPPFDLIPPSAEPTPIVVHVPHSGTRIPAAVRAAIGLSDEELGGELRRMTDHRTDVLAGDAGTLGASRFVNRLSRLVVDPERFTDPGQEEMEAVGMGAVYTATSDRRPLRALTADLREGLLAAHFRPYHAALTALVDDMLVRHGSCTIVDVHSYPSEPLPYELHGDGPRPELCVGTDRRHTPGWLRDLVSGVATDHGVDVGHDSPFAGTFVPVPHLGDARVRSVMLEIRRDLYLDEVAAEPHAGEDRIRRLCTDVVAAIAREAAVGR